MQALSTERDGALAQVASLQLQVAELEAQLNPPLNIRHLPPYSFYRRFTPNECVAIVTRMQTDPQVALIMTMLQTVRYVDLDDNDTQLGIGYLVQTGLITERSDPLKYLPMPLRMNSSYGQQNHHATAERFSHRDDLVLRILSEQRLSAPRR